MPHPPRWASSDGYQAPPGHCRYCKRPVKPPRRSWCGQPCIDEYLIRTNPGFARSAVFKRDGGVCARCGLDTVALVAELSGQGRVLTPGERELRVGLYCGVRRNPPPEHVLRRLSEGGTLWDLDHVLPVTEGGGSCGLENMQTLCLWCHDAKTHRRAACT